MKKALYGITYADLVMAALLVLGGMGIWVLTDHLIGRAMLSQTPRLENFEAAAGIPLLDARLASARAAVESIQQELAAQDMLSMQQANQVMVLQTAYPELTARQAELAKVAALPPEAVSGYIAAAVDGTAAGSLVATLEGEWQTLISEKIALSSTLSTQAPNSAGAIQTQAQLGLLEAQIGVVQAELVKQNMELLRLQAKAETYRQVFPELAALVIPTTQTTSQSPVEVAGVYLVLMRKQQESQALIQSYTARVSEMERGIAQDTQALEAARRQALQDFQQAGGAMEDRKRMLTLAWSLAAMSAFMVVALLPVFLLTRVILKNASLWAIMGSATAVTAILLAYQAFQIIGAVVLGLLVLIIILVLVLKSGLAAQVVPSKEQASK